MVRSFVAFVAFCNVAFGEGWELMREGELSQRQIFPSSIAHFWIVVSHIDFLNRLFSISNVEAAPFIEYLVNSRITASRDILNSTQVVFGLKHPYVSITRELHVGGKGKLEVKG